MYKDSRKAHSLVAMVSGLLLVLLLAAPAPADDWTSRGSSQWRRNTVVGNVGLLGLSGIRALGQSATQPIVVGNVIYHLAGKGLWRIAWSAQTQSYTPQLIADTNRSPFVPDTYLPSHSTPTYSANSGLLYFGDAFGRLWVINPNTTDGAHPIKPHEVALGCQIVSSPLVLQDPATQQDIVIVGTKPQGHPQVDGTNNCTETQGKVVALWGLDGVGNVGSDKYELGGWVTPSPIPGPSNQVDDTQVVSTREFIAGSDATNQCVSGNGIVRKFGIGSGPQGALDHLIYESWGRDNGCWPDGVADGFSELHGYVYWVDKYGTLYKKTVAQGNMAPGWPVHLEQQLGGLIFTNTVPTPIDVKDPQGNTHTLVLVTLRNFATPSDPAAITSHEDLQTRCPDNVHTNCTGAPGAIAAINESGNVEWFQRLPWDTTYQGIPLETWAAANTNPLVLQARNIVAFADVWGNLNSFWLTKQESGQQRADLLALDSTQPHTSGAFSLLQPGQLPNRAAESYSQESGAGTDPVVYPGATDGTGALLVGVNYQCNQAATYKCGYIYIGHMGASYNLRWDGPLTTGPAKGFAAGQLVTVSGQVRLEDTTLTLGQLRQQPSVEVHWYVKSSSGTIFPVSDPQNPTTLKIDLQSGQSQPVQRSFPWRQEYGDQGEIWGVIDPAGISHYGTPKPQSQALALPDMPYSGSFTPAQNAELPILPDSSDGFADNFATLPFQNLDLAVSLDAPATFTFTPGDGPQAYSVTWTAQNNSKVAIAMPVPLTIEGTFNGSLIKSDVAMLTFGPNERKSVTVSIPAGCQPGATVTSTVRVEINPAPRQVQETTYDNNVVTADTQVTCDIPVGNPYPSGTTGPGTVIIVPNDCIANPDPTSDQPCTNYPNLRIPGR